MVAAPAALAAGGAFDGGADTVSIEIPGEDVKVNGERIDCPEDGPAFIEELGHDPCKDFTIEAPPPASQDSGTADSPQRDSGEQDGASLAPTSTPAGTKTSDDDESGRVPAPGTPEALRSAPECPEATIAVPGPAEAVRSETGGLIRCLPDPDDPERSNP